MMNDESDLIHHSSFIIHHLIERGEFRRRGLTPARKGPKYGKEDYRVHQASSPVGKS
jgi:hypothetical protein